MKHDGWEYDGAFRCRVCGGVWGAISGPKVDPENCVGPTAKPLTDKERIAECGNGHKATIKQLGEVCSQCWVWARQEISNLKGKLREAEKLLGIDEKEILAELRDGRIKIAELTIKLDRVNSWSSDKPGSGSKRIEQEYKNEIVSLADLIAVKDEALRSALDFQEPDWDQIPSSEYKKEIALFRNYRESLEGALSKTHPSVDVARAKGRVVEAAKLEEIHQVAWSLASDENNMAAHRKASANFRDEKKKALAELAEAELKEKP